MEDIFSKEKEIITEAEKLLKSDVMPETACADYYGALLDEYRKLLKQMRTMVKMSDIMQKKLNSLTGEMERLSIIDELTNLYNRRFFNETYQKQWDNAARLQTHLGVLMVDIDYFKKYNDAYGHLQGDICLQKIAATIQKSVERPIDFVFRYGGEEFIVLLPDTNLNGCACVAERIRANVESLDFSLTVETSARKVTVSVGIASRVPDTKMNPEALVRLADEALYQAKEDGRNCFR